MRHRVVLALALAINTAHGLPGGTHWGRKEYSNAAPDAVIGGDGVVVPERIAQLCAAAGGCNLTVGGSAGSTASTAKPLRAGGGWASGDIDLAGALQDCDLLGADHRVRRLLGRRFARRA